MGFNPARRMERRHVIAARRDRDRLTPEERTQTATTSRAMRRSWRNEVRRKARAVTR